jgi:[ribosomal protein S5]-alanine N-acetyltransferase
MPEAPLTVRDAMPADAPDVLRVASASWRETYREIFEPAFIEDFLARNYAIPALESAIAHSAERPGSVFLVAERDGRLVGYLQFGEGERGPELFRVYADPAQFGTGVGRALLDQLHARIRGSVSSYVLDVHSRNARGRAFYDRNGFVIVGGGTAECADLTLQRTLDPPRAPLPIETARLRLRALRDTDAEAELLHRIYGDADTMRHVGGRGVPAATVADTRRTLAWLLRHQALHGFSLWAIDERDGEPLVGVAGLLWAEGHGPDVEVAYLVRRDRWGSGYATEAAAAALEVGFGALGLERIVALAWPENDASRRVMEKLGMRPDGTATAYGREMTRHVVERPA